MDTPQDLIDTETTLSLKILRFINDNDMDLLLDVEEIEARIFDANELCDRYQEVHVKVRRALGEEEYGKF